MRTTNPTIYTATVSSPGAVTVDAARYQTFVFTLQANLSGITVLNPVAGAQYTFVIKQDATGGRTYSWPSPAVWTDNAPAVTTANYRISVTFLYDGANWTEVARSGESLTDTATMSNKTLVNPTVTGGMSLTGGMSVSGGLTVSSGNVTVSAGSVTISSGLTVSSGGAAITGNSSITGTLGVSGALTVSSGGAAITGNTNVTGSVYATGNDMVPINYGSATGNRMRFTDDGTNAYIQYEHPLKFTGYGSSTMRALLDTSGNLTTAGGITSEGTVLLNTQTFPNILFQPSGQVSPTNQIIASASSLNFDQASPGDWNFRSGVNGSTVAYIDTSGGVYSTGSVAGFNFNDRDGVGGDYFSWYASSGGASLWSSVLGGNAFTVFENGNASTIGSHFFQSTTYGGRFGAGNDSGATSISQIAFGYHGVQDSYRHLIKTMHDGSTTVNNRLSLWIWRPVDATTADPSLKVAEFDGTGNLVLAGAILTQNGSPSFAGATTATSAAAGTASALPSPPAGYLVVTINGTNRKIPYYA